MALKLKSGMMFALASYLLAYLLRLWKNLLGEMLCTP